jgi:hypothetical protein
MSVDVAENAASAGCQIAAAAAPGKYLLTVAARNPAALMIRVSVRTPGAFRKAVWVPGADRTHYLLDARAAPVELKVATNDVSVFTLRPLAPIDLVRTGYRRRLRARLKLRLSPGVELMLLPRFGGAKKRELVKALRIMTAWGFGLDTSNLQDLPELFSPVAPVDQLTPKRPVPLSECKATIVLHLYWPELWPEFAERISRITLPLRLIVTTSIDDARFARSVRDIIPDAEVVVYPNRGRDIGPFLQLLNDGYLDDGPELICKLHGKRTATNGPRAIFGNIWRRATLLDLLGSDAQVRKIVARFEEDPKIGMIGSPRFRLPNEFIGEEAAWGPNRELTLQLAEKIGTPREEFRLDFYAGSMFWVRRSVLRPLNTLELTLDDFPEEHPKLDGELHHAVERLFGALPHCPGALLEDGLAFEVAGLRSVIPRGHADSSRLDKSST